MSHNAKYLFKFSKVVIIFSQFEENVGGGCTKNPLDRIQKIYFNFVVYLFFILGLLHKYLGECTYTHALNVIPMKAGKSFEGCSKTMFNYIKI